MLDLRRVRVFFEVAERRSFSAAAAALDYTQPSVSHHVLALERELGQRLINRGTRPLSLTQAGEVLHAAAVVAMAEFSRAERELRSLREGESGRILLGSVVSGLRTVVTPAALAFRARFPSADLALEESQPAEVLRGLRSGRLDVGVTVVRDGAKLPDPGMFTSDVLLELPLMAAVATGHRVASRSSVPLSALDGESWVMPSRARFPEFRAQVEELLGAAGVRPREALETTDDVAGAQLVAAGGAVGLVLDVPGLNVAGVALLPVRPAVVRRLVVVALAGVQAPPVKALFDELLVAGVSWRSGTKSRRRLP
jgi:DNA-binding transcriptional LysR family regulator